MSTESTIAATNNRPQISIVIPAYNEQANIGPCLVDLMTFLVDQHNYTVEVIVVNDNSEDDTEAETMKCVQRWPSIRLIRRHGPGGFGRALRSGLAFVTGDVVVIYMADRSDRPADILTYYRAIEDGADCAFGSRFIKGSRVKRYPKVKLVVNRIVNKVIQWMFWTNMNDLTNAFKAYRRDVIEHCGPYRACHFNITLEMSLSALISGYQIHQVPIDWEGRTWGSTNLRMREMGRRYLCTLLMLLFQRVLMSDDIVAESERTLNGDMEVSAIATKEQSPRSRSGIDSVSGESPHEAGG